MICSNCLDSIEEAQLMVLPETKICACCAQKINPPRNRAAMIFEGKTNGFMQTIDPESFKEWQYYNPYGRDTKIISNVQRVLESSEV